jgi:hypothetical protein
MTRMPTPPPVLATATPGMMPTGEPPPAGPGFAPGPPAMQPAYPQANYPAAPPQLLSASRLDASGSMPAMSDEARAIKPWMVIAAIVIVGAVLAIIVGLSGPDIPSGPLPPEPTPAAAPPASDPPAAASTPAAPAK